MVPFRYAVALLALLPLASHAQDKGEKPNAVERTAQKAGKAVERAGKAAGDGIERGAKATGRGVDRAVKSIDNATKKADQWIKEKLE